MILIFLGDPDPDTVLAAFRETCAVAADAVTFSRRFSAITLSRNWNADPSIWLRNWIVADATKIASGSN